MSRTTSDRRPPVRAATEASTDRPAWTVAIRLWIVLLVVATVLAPAAGGVAGADPGGPAEMQPDIELGVDAPASVEPGAEFGVTFRMTNAGDEPTDATGLRVTDYPAAVEVVEIRTDGKTAEQRDSVFWTDPLEPDETVSATYVFRLSADATDNVTIDAMAATDEQERRRSITIAVDANGPPTAAVGVADDPVAGEPVTLSANDSTDPDGEIVSREWDLTGDGSVDATGEQITHTFEDPGEVTVTLTVTDDDGATNSTTVSIPVAPRETETPTATPTATDAGTPTAADDSGSDSGLLSPAALVVYGLAALFVYALIKY